MRVEPVIPDRWAVRDDAGKLIAEFTSSELASEYLELHARCEAAEKRADEDRQILADIAAALGLDAINGLSANVAALVRERADDKKRIADLATRANRADAGAMATKPHVTDFGRAVLTRILSDRYFFETEESEQWCELLQEFGYVKREVYDPELHGSISDAWPGQEVWIFQGSMRSDATFSTGARE